MYLYNKVRYCMQSTHHSQYIAFIKIIIILEYAKYAKLSPSDKHINISMSYYTHYMPTAACSR